MGKCYHCSYSFIGFTSSQNYRDAHADAIARDRVGKVIYLQLSADGWSRHAFSKKGMAGVYATILNLPGDVRVKNEYMV